MEKLYSFASFSVVPIKSIKIVVKTCINIHVAMLIKTKLSSEYTYSSFIERSELPKL